MKFNPWLIVFSLVLFISAKSAFARTTGVELHDNCRWAQEEEAKLTEEEHLKDAMCVSYVIGVAEGFGLAGGHLCVPNGEGVTSRQLGIAVFKYLEKHPEELHFGSGTLVIRALWQAFPCR